MHIMNINSWLFLALELWLFFGNRKMRVAEVKATAWWVKVEKKVLQDIKLLGEPGEVGFGISRCNCDDPTVHGYAV